MKKRIVVIDSGIGGLFVLSELDKIILGYEFVYIADNLYSPYGNKSKVALKKIGVEVVENAIKKFAPEMIVVACNTLTVNAIKTLRKKFKEIVFVGVEPAIKQAKIYGGNTVVLSTPATQKKFKFLEKKINKQLKTEYHEEGLKYKNDDKLFWLADACLAAKIEDNFENLDVVVPYLKSKLLKYKDFNIENLVLGCTHYLALKPILKKQFSGLSVFDGALSVATHAKSLLKENNKKLKNKKQIKFICTNKNKEYENKLKKYYNLIKNN